VGRGVDGRIVVSAHTNTTSGMAVVFSISPSPEPESPVLAASADRRTSRKSRISRPGVVGGVSPPESLPAYPGAIVRASGWASVRVSLPPTGRESLRESGPGTGRGTLPLSRWESPRESRRDTLPASAPGTVREYPPDTGRESGMASPPGSGRESGPARISGHSAHDLPSRSPNRPTAAALGLTAGKACLQFTVNGSWSFPGLDGARNMGSVPLFSVTKFSDWRT
jgi:hypothetical protein